jgi:nitrate/nitrite transporter NarK
MGFFVFFMKLFGLISRFVNGSCCVRVAHTTRMWIVSFLTFVSFLAISYACTHNDNPAMFNLAIGASIFTGISQSFGEAVYLGFLKGFPPDLIGDVSTGTGISGLFGTITLAVAGYCGI